MCGCKEITCETMMGWNLEIGMIGWQTTSFRHATVEKKNERIK